MEIMLAHMPAALLLACRLGVSTNTMQNKDNNYNHFSVEQPIGGTNN